MTKNPKKLGPFKKRDLNELKKLNKFIDVAFLRIGFQARQIHYKQALQKAIVILEEQLKSDLC